MSNSDSVYQLKGRRNKKSDHTIKEIRRDQLEVVPAPTSSEVSIILSSLDKISAYPKLSSSSRQGVQLPAVTADTLSGTFNDMWRNVFELYGL